MNEWDLAGDLNIYDYGNLVEVECPRLSLSAEGGTEKEARDELMIKIWRLIAQKLLNRLRVHEPNVTFDSVATSRETVESTFEIIDIVV